MNKINRVIEIAKENGILINNENSIIEYDSLELVSFIVDLESQFDVSIMDDEEFLILLIDNKVSIKQISEYIEKKGK